MGHCPQAFTSLECQACFVRIDSTSPRLNRVRAGLSPALPTAPGMRVRTGRFNDDGET